MHELALVDTENYYAPGLKTVVNAVLFESSSRMIPGSPIPGTGEKGLRSPENVRLLVWEIFCLAITV